MSKDRIVEKIKKVLALANKNPSEAEAQTAMLMAQELMAKYDIEMKEVDVTDDTQTYKAFEMVLSDEKGINAPWKKHLLSIIASNFRCKTFFQSYTNSSVHHAAFIGLQADVEIAAMMYVYAVNVIDKGMYRCYRKFRDSGKIAQGVRGDYVVGFLKGLADKYDEQVSKNGWALVLTVHPVVQQQFDSMALETRKSNAKTPVQGNSEARSMGYKDGKEFASPHTQIGGGESNEG